MIEIYAVIWATDIYTFHSSFDALQFCENNGLPREYSTWKVEETVVNA